MGGVHAGGVGATLYLLASPLRPAWLCDAHSRDRLKVAAAMARPASDSGPCSTAGIEASGRQPSCPPLPLHALVPVMHYTKTFEVPAILRKRKRKCR